MTRVRILAIGLRGALVAGLALTAAACGGESDPDPGSSDAKGLTVQMSVALKADAISRGCPAKLEYPDVRSLRLRIYDGPVDALEQAAVLFDTSSPSFAPDGCMSFVQCADPRAARMDANDGRSQDEKAQACEDAGSVLVAARNVAVDRLAEATDATIYVELYADEGCQEPVFVALRGGVDIRSGAPPTIAMTPLCVGHFTELPHPIQDNPGFSREVAQAECAVDCDCLDDFADTPGVRACTEAERQAGTYAGAPLRCASGRCSRDYAFEGLLTTACDSDDPCRAVYSESHCDREAGFCTPSSYYPLAPASPRAFHSATALPSGHVALVGGLTRRNASGLVAEAVPVELFDPRRFVFGRANYRDADGGSFETRHLGRAFHATTLAAGDTSLVLGGGLREIDVRIVDGASGRQLVLGPTSGLGDEANYRSDLVLLDVERPTEATRGRTLQLQVTSLRGEVSQTLSQPYAGATAAFVANTDNTEHFFTGGFAPSGSPGTQDASGETAPFANLVINCVFSAQLSASCLVNPNVLGVARAAATLACFAIDEQGACGALALVGGARLEGAPVAELFRLPSAGGGAGGFVGIDDEGAAPLRRSKFTRTFSLPGEGLAFSFGGSNDDLFGTAPNVPTFALSLDEGAEGQPELRAAKVDASGAPGGETATLRAHHSVTELHDGRLLISGGLDADNRPTTQALLFDPASLQYLDRLVEMNRPRFGHTAIRITRGPLAGAVLVVGGLDAPGGSGPASLVPVAEIYVPER